jgi:Holliday junction DNA helicase RuvA
MIAYLKGTIIEKGLTYIILENNNIGYKVFATPETLDMKVGETVALFIYHKVSEDSQSLYGLPDFQTLQFFELLITVSGVGPKVALAILVRGPRGSGQAGHRQPGRGCVYQDIRNWPKDGGEDNR